MSPKVDTVVQFSGLKTGRYEYEYVLDSAFFEEYENEELREGNVNFEVVLERHERMLLFYFSFHGEIITTCDRCLGELEVPVSGEEQLCVKFSDTETSDDEEVVFLPESAYQIDLAQWMYEYVLVRMPMQKVHDEGDCDPEMLKFIQEESAEERMAKEGAGEVRTMEEGETDPRWDALKQLLDK